MTLRPALEKASAVLLVALEPEEESAILFLRLRKASRHGRAGVLGRRAGSAAAWHKMSGTLIGAEPGTEAAVLAGLPAMSRRATGSGRRRAQRARRDCCARPVPSCWSASAPREIPGLLTAVGELVDATGAGLAWVPRRAGERGALDAGALGTLLPGGRPLSDPRGPRRGREPPGARRFPATPGRDTSGILAAVGILEARGRRECRGNEPEEPSTTSSASRIEIDDPEDRSRPGWPAC